MYQFLMFFMLTDPRTTVSSTKGRVLVTILIALAECGLRLFGRERVSRDQQSQEWCEIALAFRARKLARLQWGDWRSHAEVEMLRG